MAEIHNSNADLMSVQGVPNDRENPSVHSAWMRLIRYCAELGHGEIEKLKIQDGLPVAAEVTTKKVKFSP